MIEALPVILFGTGSMAARALPQIKVRQEFHIVVCADNNVSKQGSLWNGIPVVSPRDIDGMLWAEILVASSFAMDIVQELAESGVDFSRITVLNMEEISSCLDQIVERAHLRLDARLPLTGHCQRDGKWPSVLLLTDETINATHGTGVVLQRFFSNFPRANLFSVHRSGLGWSSIPHSYCVATAPLATDLRKELARMLDQIGFQPDLIYSTAYIEPDLTILEAILDIVPREVPVIHHFLDFAPRESSAYLLRFSRMLSTSRRNIVWAFTKGLADMLESRLARPVAIVSALYQSLPDETKTIHDPWTKDFRVVMLGNLWQPQTLAVVNHIWAGCQAVLSSLRPIDWFIHPLRVQTFIDAGYDIGDQVVWRGFVPSLQERLRGADLAILPFNVEERVATGYSRFSLPSRLTELCAAGLPIFALASADTELARFITHHGNGRVADASDEEATVRALVNFIRDQPARAEAGKRARETAEREFDLQPFLVNFQDNLRAIASAGGGGACDVQT